MGSPLLVVDNLFSQAIYALHVVAANEAPVGNEAFRVADGRRTATDRWTTSTANADAWIKVTCDRTRAADCIVVDRGHNLAGKVIKLECSDDDFTTIQSVLTLTLPSATAPLSIDDALGVRTEEGAWLKRFPVRAARYWRLFVPALGAGLRPQVVGLWLGAGYAPSPLRLPVAENLAQLIVQEQDSDAGWLGASAGTLRRQGTLRFKLGDLFEYDLFRLYVEGMFSARRPMWIVQDAAQADRAVLAVRTPGVLGLNQRTSEYFPPSGEIGWVEHEPRRGA